MSLKARLDRIEAAANWLRYDGRLLLYQRQLEVLDMDRRYDEALERHERAKEEAEARAKQQAAQRAAQRAADELAEQARLAAAHAAQEEVEPVHERASGEEPGSTVEPPPEPEQPPASTDIPEEMQIRPVRWRRRGPDDWLDDLDEDDVPSVLTEYDPLAECDEDDSS